MSNWIHELELEGSLEGEGEFGEFEFGELGEIGELGELGEFGELSSEGALEGEHEADQFFGQLAGLAARAAKSPALRRVALGAAKSALSGIGSLLGEGEEEAEAEAEFGEMGEFGEFESTGQLYSPIRRAYPDAVMEHMAHKASTVENEDEAAEQFLPLIPMLAAKLAPLALKALPMAGKLAAKLAPKVLSTVNKVAPKLTKGIGQITRTLHKNPQTRPLIRAIPKIARRTVADVARNAARGKLVSSQAAIRSLAQQTARTLSNPRTLSNTWKRARALDRQLHRATSPIGVAPAGDSAAASSDGAAGATCPTCGR